MMRCLAIACFVFICSVAHSVADAHHPLAFSVSKQYTGTVVPFGKNFILRKQTPAWNSTDPVLMIITPKGDVLHSACKGEDIRAIQAWGTNIIAIRALPASVNIVVFDSTLQQIYEASVSGIDQGAGDEDYSIVASEQLQTVFVQLADKVVAVRPRDAQNQATVIEDGVFGIGLINSKHTGVAIVHDVGGIAFVSVVADDFTRRIAPSVPLSARCRVRDANGLIALMAPIDDDAGMQLTLVDPNTSLTRTVSIPTSAPLACVFTQNGNPLIATIIQKGARDTLAILDPNEKMFGAQLRLPLTGELGEPLSIEVHTDTIFVFCSAGVLVTTSELRVLAQSPMPIIADAWTLQSMHTSNGLLVSSATNTMILRESSQPWWWAMWTLQTLGAYIVTLVLSAIIIVLALKLRRQRRYINAMLELPGTGIVFTIDAGGRLTRTNERAASVLRITPRVPMGRSFHSYMRHNGADDIREFVSQAYNDRRPMSEKVHVDDDDEQREYVFTAVPLFGTVGNLRGIVITGVDITEALEKRRLVNWAQLAHDMQTNLSTIRLNAEQLSREGSSTNQERLRRILFQTHVLTQRVRDLVSVGRSDELTLASVHSAEFCTNLRHEFDPEMFPHVDFSMKLRGTMVNVDRLKLSRAIRNAIENAIKSLRGDPGTVEIATWADRTHVFFRISDTGVGMDTLTLENMMKPYYTTSKDGTGTGIGTMIMQHVTNLHGGSLRVTSEPGEGTQVVFRIPHRAESVRVDRSVDSGEFVL